MRKRFICEGGVVKPVAAGASFHSRQHIPEHDTSSHETAEQETAIRDSHQEIAYSARQGGLRHPWLLPMRHAQQRSREG